jgi:hypothetical protein
MPPAAAGVIVTLASGYDDQDRYDRQEHDISHRLADT